MESGSIVLHHPLPPEDAARADFYALLAHLYADAPDAALLAAIAAAPPLLPAVSPDEGVVPSSALVSAWDRLRAASSVMEPDAARQEYTELFVGVGECPVNLHASHWLTGFMMDRPLAELRTELQALGLARRTETQIVEDHLSALCETMRILVAGQDLRRPEPIARQRAFFASHLLPWIQKCCDAIVSNGVANYYRPVAQFTIEFMALERDSLAMDDLFRE